MNKNFNFSNEMNSSEVHTIIDYLKEEDRLLKENSKEIIKLNNNIHKMIGELETLAISIHNYKLSISKETEGQAKVFVNGLIHSLHDEVNSILEDIERKRKKYKDETFIEIPTKTFYILFIIMISLFFFFISTVVANIHSIESSLIWEILVWGIGIVITLLGILLLMHKLMGIWK